VSGRHVGQEVARRAIEEGVALGGEERDAAVLFVDLMGSTSFAADRGATEVVAMLNAFFGIVVETTRRHGGFVNKFEGDAALCIFGVPLVLEDAAGGALAAGREMQARLVCDLPEIRAAIGLSAGTVVAGNVGAADRFEYTVIGDPVNEAARLAELAKDHPGRIVASETIVARAGIGEAAGWQLAEAVLVRGRTRPTRLAMPAAGAAGWSAEAASASPLPPRSRQLRPPPGRPAMSSDPSNRTSVGAAGDGRPRVRLTPGALSGTGTWRPRRTRPACRDAVARRRSIAYQGRRCHPNGATAQHGGVSRRSSCAWRSALGSPRRSPRRPHPRNPRCRRVSRRQR